MDSKKRTILVMDANQRSALAVVRALGTAFPDASISTADETPSALAGKSRHSDNYLQHPSPSTTPNAFLTWVKDQVLGHYDLIMPTTEITSQLLLLNQSSLTGLPLAFACIDTVMKLADKSNLVKSAEYANVPVPISQHFNNSDSLNIDQITFPIVLKPALSKIFTNDHWISTTVRVLRSRQDLEKALKHDEYLKKFPFMLQEYIEGHGAGIFCLYNHGKPIQYFAHNRLREKPPEGGISVLSQAAPVDNQLRDYAERLLKSVNWHGVAMVEFRIAKDGTPYLMEVNTRFWGSLQLAVDSGVNFPVQLAQIFFNEPVQSVKTYNIHQRLRWTLGDLDSLYIFLKRNYTFTAKLKRIGQFLTPSFKHQKHEVNRWSDFKPFLEELKQYIGLR